MHNILTVNNTIPISCKTVLLNSQRFIDLLPTIELLIDGLIFIGSISHLILTSQCQDVKPILRLDGRGYWNVSGKSEYNFFEKMKVYNKTVIDRLLGHQQFCLTLEWICCGKPQAEGNRSVLRSNKLLYAINKSIDYSIEHWLICIDDPDE